jgi:hypothetical protein
MDLKQSHKMKGQKVCLSTHGKYYLYYSRLILVCISHLFNSE